MGHVPALNLTTTQFKYAHVHVTLGLNWLRAIVHAMVSVYMSSYIEQQRGAVSNFCMHITVLFIERIM